jgi:probable rRNA maturation factor
VALKTLKLGGGPIPCSLSLAFVGDSLIRNLNREYRALDRTTDVLSFSSEDLDPEYGIVHIGDVVVSVQAADRQAAHVHRELSQELEMLVAHGVLHLLGFDHNSRAKRTRMLGLQGKILRSSDHSDGPR